MEQLRPLRELVFRWVEAASDVLRLSAFARGVDAMLELAPARSGRTGFLHLGTELLMEWRLEAVAHALDQRSRHPLARVILAGDANVHLAYVVAHDQSRARLHCRQRAADRAIEAALEAAGLRAFNPVAPTRVPGHCIDLVLGVVGNPIPARVHPDLVGGSDNRLVLADVPCAIAAPLCLGFGRVLWASGSEWEGGLLDVSSLLDHVAALVEGAAGAPAMKPDCQKQMRARAGIRAPLNPASFADHMAFKHAVDMALWEKRRHAVARHVHLRSVSLAAAERFLSGYFQGAARFSVQLDAAEAARLSRSVAEIRRVGARSPAAPFPAPPDAHTLDEVSRAIAMLKPHKCTVRGTNAALLAEVPAGRRLTRALDLPTWWALADEKWAFGVAPFNAMLLGAFQAGVRGPDWLLLDDVLAQDHQRVCLHGFLSPVFALGCGTAQGRRLSVPVFNAQLRWLADEVAPALPRGRATLIPSFTRRAFHEALEA
ncbi:unnamed protein product, partial [Prorocentrum cordatum]